MKYVNGIIAYLLLAGLSVGLILVPSFLVALAGFYSFGWLPALLFWICFPLGLLLNLGIMFWFSYFTYQHAKKIREQVEKKVNPAVWFVVVFFLGWLGGLLFYFMVVKKTGKNRVSS